MSRRSLRCVACFVYLVVAVPAFAGTLLYSNGPINGNINAWTINYGYEVSNTYTISQSAGWAQVGLWLFPGDTVTSISWAFGTNYLLSDISSGTSPVYVTNLYINSYGVQIAEASFRVNAPAGSGWLTLYNAVATSGDIVFWDENDGPSSAWSGGPASTSPGPIGSESFQLYTVPEIGTLLSLGSGVIGMAGVLRRKLLY